MIITGNASCQKSNMLTSEIPIKIYRTSFPRHPKCLNFKASISSGATNKQENTTIRDERTGSVNHN